MCTLPEISLLEACAMWVSWQRREILCMVILLDLDWRVTTYWPLAQRTMIMQLQQLDLTTEVGISDSIDKCSCGNLGFTSH
jgi:hypothetical protein